MQCGHGSLNWNSQKLYTCLRIGACISAVLTGEASRLAMSINQFNSAKSSTSYKGIAKSCLQDSSSRSVCFQLNCFITFRCSSQVNMNLFYTCQKESVRIAVGQVTGAREPATREELVSRWRHVHPASTYILLASITQTL